jgi:vitamin B12 transporter
MDNLKSVFFFLIIFFLSTTYSQEKDSLPLYKLTDIVISATKTKTSTLYLANSVSVIDSAEISRKERISLLDLLKSEYGLSFTTQGNAGSNSFVTIRGANAGHTLVLIDGVEMNRSTDPGNTFDFSTITTENIDRIEILRGPQSTLYGSDATAGVINIFTKKGSSGLKLNLSSEAGSFNTYKGSASVSGGKGILDFNINFGRTISDGFSSASEKYGNTEKDGFRNSTFNSRAGLNFSSSLSLDLVYHFTKAAADLDWAGGILGDHEDYLSDTEETGFRGSVFYKTTDNWEQTAGVSFRRNLRKYSYSFNPVSFGPSDSRYDGNRLKADWQSNLYLNDNIISAGLEYEVEGMNSDYNEYSFQSFTHLPEVSNTTFGVFLQDQLTFNSFHVTGGLRFDNNERFGTKFTYRFAPAYLINSTGTKIKFTYGTGFKSPSLTNIYDPIYGTKDLRPESSSGWDAGIEQFFVKSSVSAGVNYFSLQFEDMFVYDPVAMKIKNLNKSSSQGIELFLSGEIINELRIKSSYTFTEPKEEINGKEQFSFLRKAKHKASFSLDYLFFDNAYAGAEVIYNGKRTDTYFAPDFTTETKTLQDYLLLNLTASYKFFNTVKLYARIENLLDKDYEETYGFATPGFSVYAGVKIDTGNLVNW